MSGSSAAGQSHGRLGEYAAAAGAPAAYSALLALKSDPTKTLPRAATTWRASAGGG